MLAPKQREGGKNRVSILFVMAVLGDCILELGQGDLYSTEVSRSSRLYDCLVFEYVTLNTLGNSNQTLSSK